MVLSRSHSLLFRPPQKIFTPDTYTYPIISFNDQQSIPLYPRHMHTRHDAPQLIKRRSTKVGRRIFRRFIEGSSLILNKVASSVMERKETPAGLKRISMRLDARRNGIGDTRWWRSGQEQEGKQERARADTKPPTATQTPSPLARISVRRKVVTPSMCKCMRPSLGWLRLVWPRSWRYAASHWGDRAFCG